MREEIVYRHHSQDEEPVHAFFGLSYSSYLVLPRTLLQSMPHEWQARLVALLEEAQAATRGTEAEGALGTYMVRLTGERNRFRHDPLANYERGRRHLELNAYRERTAEEVARDDAAVRAVIGDRGAA